MSENKALTEQPVELDLSGFRRRIPRAALAWYAGQLGAGGTLSLNLNPAADSELLSEVAQENGLDIVANDVKGETRLLLMRKNSVPSTTRELDMRGRRCPDPVIEARRQLRKMRTGARLRLVSDCTGSPAEVGTWAANTDHVAMLGTWHQGRDHVFLIGRV